MRSLSIQLDNLCQFLPQDRVQDFAKQDSVQLLQNTEKAVGTASNMDLLAKHKELIDLQKQISAHTVQLGRTEELLRVEQGHHGQEKEQMRMFREREQITNEIVDIEGKRLWLLHQKAEDEFNKVKFLFLNIQSKHVSM